MAQTSTTDSYAAKIPASGPAPRGRTPHGAAAVDMAKSTPNESQNTPPTTSETAPARPMVDWETLVVDAVGNVIEFWGFKHNHGRVWALLYLRDEELTAAELQEVLGLSKGAVSMLARELERWRVIDRRRWPGDPTWRFVANTDFMAMVRRVLETREKEFLVRVMADLDRAHQIASATDSARPGALERLQRMRVLADWTDSAVRTFLRTASLDASPLLGILTWPLKRIAQGWSS